MRLNAISKDRRRPALLRRMLWIATVLCLCVQCRLAPEPETREENYVTVRLNDSLSRFDNVVVQLLADGDTGHVLGILWSGRLEEPEAIPSYRLDEGGTPDLAVRVRAWDASGRLALDETIAKQDGKSIVTVFPIPRPSPLLASLDLSAGKLSPAFAAGSPGYTASVPYSQGSIQVTATPQYAEAQMYANIRPLDAGKPSEPLPLDTGANRITVLVLAGDTSAQYVVTVRRAGPPADTAKPVPGDTGKPVPPDTVKPPVNPLPAWQHHGTVVLRLPTAGSRSSHAMATDFPLLLRLTSANFRFPEAADSGRDLRFLDLNGKNLDYAIARWDAAAQLAEIYLRCDTLSPERAAPVFSMYWGNPKAAAASNPSAVFPRSRGWTGVWHLDEKGAGHAGEYLDATGSFPGTALGAFPKRVDGVVGAAQDFLGNGGQGYISLPSGFDPGVKHFTMHMWIYRTDRSAGYLINKSALGPDDQRFEADLTQGTGVVEFGRTGASGSSRFISGVAPQVGAWTLLGIVCDGDSARLYGNGLPVETHPFKPGGNPLSNVLLGARSPNGSDGFSGRMDEFWGFDGVRDAWYMRLIYENQKPGSTMATLTQF
jgi:hypothetical protein